MKWLKMSYFQEKNGSSQYVVAVGSRIEEQGRCDKIPKSQTQRK